MTVTAERPARRVIQPDRKRNLRRQLPVYSPLSAGAILRAGTAIVRRSAGPRRRLESALRSIYRADAVTLTGSGTQALELAIRSAWELAGPAVPSIVALPAFTCFDVATAAVGSGLSIALYDVDPDTLGPDPDSLRVLLESGVRIVVVPHLYGFPVDWAELHALAARYGAVLIEDAAQGHGGTWRKHSLGSLAEISVLSFGRGKGWTGSQGGALLLRGARSSGNPGRALRPPSLRAESRAVITAAAQWWLARPAWYWLPAAIPALGLGETRYHEPGPVRRMTRAAATMALCTRKAASTEAAARRWNGWELRARLPLSDRVRTVRRQPDAEPGFLRLPVRISGGWAGWDDKGRAMGLGIAPAYPRTLNDLPAVREVLVGAGKSWPGGAALTRELITLPTHSRLTADERTVIMHLLEAYHG